MDYLDLFSGFDIPITSIGVKTMQVNDTTLPAAQYNRCPWDRQSYGLIFCSFEGSDKTVNYPRPVENAGLSTSDMGWIDSSSDPFSPDFSNRSSLILSENQLSG